MTACRQAYAEVCRVLEGKGLSEQKKRRTPMNFQIHLEVIYREIDFRSAERYYLNTAIYSKTHRVMVSEGGISLSSLFAIAVPVRMPSWPNGIATNSVHGIGNDVIRTRKIHTVLTHCHMPTQGVRGTHLWLHPKPNDLQGSRESASTS